MIRTVSIPKTVSRMDGTASLGCAKGSGCCSECGDHSVTELARSAAGASRMGDVQCDPDGNCYTDGVLTAAPLTHPAGVASGLSTTTVYVIGAAIVIGLLEALSRRR